MSTHVVFASAIDKSVGCCEIPKPGLPLARPSPDAPFAAGAGAPVAKSPLLEGAFSRSRAASWTCSNARLPAASTGGRFDLCGHGIADQGKKTLKGTPSLVYTGYSARTHAQGETTCQSVQGSFS